MAPMNMLIVKHLKHENNRSVIEIIIDREMTNLHGVLPETMEKMFLVVPGHKNTYRHETSPGDLVILDILKVLRKAHWGLMTSHSFVHLSIEKTVESHFYFEKPSAKELELMHQQQQFIQMQMQMQNKFSPPINPNLNFHPLNHDFKPEDNIESLRSDSGDGTKNKLSAEVTTLLYDKSQGSNSGPYGFAKRQSYLTVQNPKIRKDLSISVDSTNGGDLYLHEENANLPRSRSLDFDGSNKYSHYEQPATVVKNEINPLRKDLSPIREVPEIKPVEQSKSSNNSRSTTPTSTNKLLQKYSKKPFSSPSEVKQEIHQSEQIKLPETKHILETSKPIEQKVINETKHIDHLKEVIKPQEIVHPSVENKTPTKTIESKSVEPKIEQPKTIEKKPIVETKPHSEVEPEKPKEEDQNKKLLKSTLSFLRTPRVEDEKEKPKSEDANEFGSFLKSLRHVEDPPTERKKAVDLLIEVDEPADIPEVTATIKSDIKLEVKHEGKTETKAEPTLSVTHKVFETISPKVETTPQKLNDNVSHITPKSVNTPLQSNFQSPVSSSITPPNITTTPSTDANDTATRRSSVSSSKLLSKYQPKRRSSVNSSSNNNLKSPSLSEDLNEVPVEEKKDVPVYKSPYLFPDSKPVESSNSNDIIPTHDRNSATIISHGSSSNIHNSSITTVQDSILNPVSNAPVMIQPEILPNETLNQYVLPSNSDIKPTQPSKLAETPVKTSEVTKSEPIKIAEPIKVEPPSPKPIITPSVNTSILPKQVENREISPPPFTPPTLTPPNIQPNQSLDEALEGLVDRTVEDVDLEYSDSNDYFAMSSNAFKKDEDPKTSAEHENSKTNHYSKLGSAFVSGNALNNRGRGGGRGRGRGLN